MRFAASVLAVLLLLAAGGCPRQAREDRAYDNEKFCLRFLYPPGWEQVRPDGALWIDAWLVPDPGGRFMVFADEGPEWFFTPLEDDFRSFVDRLKGEKAGFILEEQSPGRVHDREGIGFRGRWGDQGLHGVFFKKNTAAFCLAIRAPQGRTVEAKALLQKVIKSTSVCERNADVEKFLAGLRGPRELKRDDIRSALAYGRELLNSRELNVKNYTLSQKEFLRVLAALHGEEDPGPEYKEALRLLEISEAFQDEAFRVHRFELEKAVGLSDQDEAYEQLHYILGLVPDSGDPRHRYADRMYQKVREIR